MIKAILSADPDEQMPPKGPRLNAAEVATLTQWIGEGALWPDGVDKVKLADPRAKARVPNQPLHLPLPKH